MRNFSLLFLVPIAASLLSGRLQAQPLILANPTSTSAFVGDATATFSVLTAGNPSPSYQWQVSTNNGSGAP